MAVRKIQLFSVKRRDTILRLFFRCAAIKYFSLSLRFCWRCKNRKSAGKQNFRPSRNKWHHVSDKIYEQTRGYSYPCPLALSRLSLFRISKSTGDVARSTTRVSVFFSTAYLDASKALRNGICDVDSTFPAVALSPASQPILRYFVIVVF